MSKKFKTGELRKNVDKPGDRVLVGYECTECENRVSTIGQRRYCSECGNCGWWRVVG